MSYPYKAAMDAEAALASIRTIAKKPAKVGLYEVYQDAADLIEVEMVRLHRALSAWKEEERDEPGDT